MPSLIHIIQLCYIFFFLIISLNSTEMTTINWLDDKLLLQLQQEFYGYSSGSFFDDSEAFLRFIT